MDFECDFGYVRVDGGSCVLSPAAQGDEWEQYLKDKMEDQCEDLGYYEVSRGYRKIP